ncbi:hypothetical protein [Bradyrhizobium japonicum]|uniref:hypothetical protein n=1 Tax=Bradyrhizobium japonicum TaxID=375 RepID=UPI001B89DFEB|nr:hypothetical protein [Bradyrhizobium japonicum]MBR0972309.1 hypothetical protein [Bradyrhizobium japonicum]
MSPRIIPIPLSGDLRKAQAKGVRYADGLHNTYFDQTKLIRSAAEAKIREADRLECEAWNALMWAWATDEMRPVIDDQQANPTIGKAINGGYDLLEAKCKRCRRLSLVPLRAVKRPARTPILMLEDALFCEPCSEGKHYTHRQRAFIVGLTFAKPDSAGKASRERRKP